MTRTRFAKFAWILLIYNLVVMVFGAFVRASFSGDGCGPNWPLCNGEVIPTNASVQRLVEFTHRASTGIDGVLIAMLCFWAFRLFAPKAPIRGAAVGVIGLVLAESLAGAWLVKYKLVAHNSSVYRVEAMAVHLTITLLLLAALTFTAVLAHDASEPLSAAEAEDRRVVLRGQGPVMAAVVFGLACVLVLGITGVISALGNQLRPVDNVIQAALAPGANFLNRLEPLHPLIATSVGLYLLLMGGLIIHLRPSPSVKLAVQRLVGVFLFQVGVGVLNIWIKAPIWMQLFHLLSAYACWMALLMVGIEAFRHGAPRRDVETASSPREGVRPTGTALIKEYVALTKPKVISLLLFTTMTAMFAAAHGWPGAGLFWGLLIGGYMSAGAANSINMVIDRDIDGTMKRTSKRPTVTENISSRGALTFGFVLAGLSFATIWAASNLLAAMLSLAGLVFYVIVYTLLLKRRTWQNIVIGGAAGCFPPLVGWAAVTGQLSPLAIVLFAIIFMWTPVHFWALALLIKEDYARAGVPMLPVVRGDRVTVVQITFYGVLTAIVSALPLVEREAGWLYMGVIVLLNAVLLLRCVQLYRIVDRPRAASLYKFSLAYLFLLFLTVAVDRALIGRQPAALPKGQVVSEIFLGRDAERTMSEGIIRTVVTNGSAI